MTICDDSVDAVEVLAQATSGHIHIQSWLNSVTHSTLSTSS